MENSLIWAALALCFFQSWYINLRLERAHEKLDALLKETYKSNHPGIC